jgi:hypothetical protein
MAAGVGVTDGNLRAGATIRNSNGAQALLDDFEARGYKLSVSENGKLRTDDDSPPMTPVIWHALQANYGKLVQVLSEDVTDSNCRNVQNVRNDNTDYSKVADLQPARGEEFERAMSEYREALRAASEAVKAAAPEDAVKGMFMHWREADKRRSPRDREAKRRIDAASKGEACGKCGRTLEDGETVYAKCQVYTGMAGGLMSRPGPRFTPASVCEGCAPKWMAERKTYNEYTINGKTVRVPESRRFAEQPCSMCERPVVYKLTARDYHGRHVFCCYRCQYTYHNRRRARRGQRLREKTCGVCGTEFTARRAHTKTCSPACKQKSYRLRKKATA